MMFMVAELFKMVCVYVFNIAARAGLTYSTLLFAAKNKRKVE